MVFPGIYSVHVFFILSPIPARTAQCGGRRFKDRKPIGGVRGWDSKKQCESNSEQHRSWTLTRVILQVRICCIFIAVIVIVIVVVAAAAAAAAVVVVVVVVLTD